MNLGLAILWIGAAFLFVMGLAVLVLRVFDQLTNRGPKAAGQHDWRDREFQLRLLNPKWRELESHFGYALPNSFRELYSNSDRVLQSCFYVVPPNAVSEDEHYFIARFQPADMQTLKDVWFPVGDSRFPFATDDFGNYFCIELSPEMHDAPVVFMDHDSGDISLVATSLEDFRTWQTYSDAESRGG